MEHQNSLTIFTQASKMLAQANTIQKAKELKDLALTAADWAKRKGMGEEAIRYARSYALEAERKMGEMLLQKPPAVRGRPGTGRGKKGSTSQLPAFSNEVLSIEDLGLTKRESSEAQRLASLPEESFKEIKEGFKSKKTVFREQTMAKIAEEQPELPTGKFRVIYADPPWKYGDQLTEDYGPTTFHYPSLSIPELCGIPISELADDNSVLFLWVTSPILFECLPLIKSWGFTYKASFVWDKIKHNMGHYNSVRHEFLLVCTRGSCTPDNPKLYDSVQSIERTAHSKKPEEFRKIIESLYVHGKKLELFAREEHEGWTVYGNQLPGNSL